MPDLTADLLVNPVEKIEHHQQTQHNKQWFGHECRERVLRVRSLWTKKLREGRLKPKMDDFRSG
jgi:hypothetical protein